MDEIKRIQLDQLIQQRTAQAESQAAELAARSLPESPSVYEGLPNPRSSKTLEKLRGLTQNLSANLAEARHAHVVHITSMATELVDVQNETIQELEKHVGELEKELNYYRTWEDSREVVELVERIKALEADKEVLAGRLAAALLGR